MEWALVALAFAWLPLLLRFKRKTKPKRWFLSELSDEELSEEAIDIIIASDWPFAVPAPTKSLSELQKQLVGVHEQLLPLDEAAGSPPGSSFVASGLATVLQEVQQRMADAK